MVLFSRLKNKPQKLTHAQKEYANDAKYFPTLTKKAAIWSAGALAVLLTPVLAAALAGDAPESVFSENPDSHLQIEAKTSTDEDAGIDANIEHNATANDGTSGSVSSDTTEVTVNGQTIPVPEDGHIHETIENPGGRATVNIDIDSQSSSSSDNGDGSARIRIRSHTDNDVRIRSSH